MDRFYDAGIDRIFSHKAMCVAFCVISVPLCVFWFYFIGKERMPEIDRNELMARVEWNENIHVDENRNRVDALFRLLADETTEQTAAIGRQDYLLNREQALSMSEAELYFKAASPEEVAPLQKKVYESVKSKYPLAVVSFSPPEMVFEKLL